MPRPISYAVFCLKKKTPKEKRSGACAAKGLAVLQTRWSRDFTSVRRLFIFFLSTSAATEIYTLSLHDALPILNATGGGFLTASKQFRHGATSKSRSNTASNSTKHKSPHLSGWRQIISLIT